MKEGIGLVSMIFSLIAASLLSSLVVARAVAENLITEFGLDDIISDIPDVSLDSLEGLFLACVSMIVSSVVFLLLYFAFRLLCRIVIAIIYRTVLKGDPNDLGYIGEDEPWYVRNSGAIGAVIGGISGFLAVAICFSPIVGNLKTADRVINILEDFDAIDKRDSDAYGLVEDYSSDFGATVIYYCGGKVIYDLGARTRMDRHTVILSREVKTMENVADDVKLLADSFKDVEDLNAKEFQGIKRVCEKISDSYLVTSVAAGFVSSAAEKWQNDEEFMGVEFPMTNDTLDPVFDGMLGVFASTTADNVASDFYTFSEVSIIVIESGLLDAGEDYDSVMSVLEDGSIINKLTAALEGNSRMAFISDILYRTAMKTLVKTIKFDGYNIDEYDNLINDITDQFNRMQGQKDDKKIATITDYTVQYISDYGVDVPDSVARMIVSAMVEEITPDSSGYIDPSQISDFFDRYYTPVN